MQTHIAFPETVKKILLSMAKKNNYLQAIDILQRGNPDELILKTNDEAQAIVNVARVKLLDTLLKYPYWDEDMDNYNENHEEEFQEVQMGIYEKTVSYIMTKFDIQTTT